MFSLRCDSSVSWRLRVDAVGLVTSDVLLVVEGSSKGAWVIVVEEEADMGVSCRVMGCKGEGRWVLVDCSWGG